MRTNTKRLLILFLIIIQCICTYTATATIKSKTDKFTGESEYKHSKLYAGNIPNILGWRSIIMKYKKDQFTLICTDSNVMQYNPISVGFVDDNYNKYFLRADNGTYQTKFIKGQTVIEETTYSYFDKQTAKEFLNYLKNAKKIKTVFIGSNDFRSDVKFIPKKIKKAMIEMLEFGLKH